MLGPGLLVAATGVGAGDLMTASIAGSKFGLAMIGAVLIGALMKWVLTEGIARWQLATGETLLEGWSRYHLDKLFLPFLIVWSVAVGAALMSACGVAAHAFLPLGDNETTSRQIWGAAHGIVGAAMVFIGGYKLFERFMTVCIAIMFVAVVVCATRMLSEAPAAMPVPDLQDADARKWFIAVVGGVGGTVTLLSYGYWIREENRRGWEGVRTSRVDLALGYFMAALFGVGMILIARTLPGLEGKGASLAVPLADRVGEHTGAIMRWLFLAGFWGAVFSSLLGVWQSVPYLFADVIRGLDRARRTDRPPLNASWTYRSFVLFLTVAPLPLLSYKVAHIQLLYTLTGVLIVPVLAATLLVLNNHPALMPRRFRSGPALNGLLIITLSFFVWTGWQAVWAKFG